MIYVFAGFLDWAVISAIAPEIQGWKVPAIVFTVTAVQAVANAVSIARAKA